MQPEDYRGYLKQMHPERSYPSYITGGGPGNYHPNEHYDNDAEAMGRSLDNNNPYPGAAARRPSYFLHKLDPTYKNSVRRNLQKRQDTIQNVLKVSYMILAFATIFGFACMIVSQKLVTYSNLSSTEMKPTSYSDDVIVIWEEPKEKSEMIPVPNTPKGHIPMDTRENDIIHFLQNISPATLLVKNSPQNRALKWITQDDPLKLPSPKTSTDAKRVLQRYALATFFFATGGENWVEKYGFLSDKHECHWNEVSGGFFHGAGGCAEGDGQTVTLLSLWNNNLLGKIPAEIGHLQGLTALTLFDNQLMGEIPSDLNSLSNLSTLYLEDNTLEGSLQSFCSEKNDIKIKADCADPFPKVICTCCSCS